MAGIFISYRRDDSAAITGRIFDRLNAHFGVGKVFMDIDSIPIGHDFRDHIGETLVRCDVMLAVVGHRWTGPAEKGRRIDDPADLVRLELEGGLARNIPVVPVLVEGAATPSPLELPESLRGFSYRNAAAVDSGKDFHPHVDRLIRDIEALIERRERGAATAEAKQTEPRPAAAKRAAPVRPPTIAAPAPKAAPAAGAAAPRSYFLVWSALTVLVAVIGFAFFFAGGNPLTPEAIPIYAGIVLLVLVLVAAQCALGQRWHRATAAPTAAATGTNFAFLLSLALFSASIVLVQNDAATETRATSDALAWAAVVLLAGGVLSLLLQFFRLRRAGRP